MVRILKAGAPQSISNQIKPMEAKISAKQWLWDLMSTLKSHPSRSRKRLTWDNQESLFTIITSITQHWQRLATTHVLYLKLVITLTSSSNTCHPIWTQRTRRRLLADWNLQSPSSVYPCWIWWQRKIQGRKAMTLANLPTLWIRPSQLATFTRRTKKQESALTQIKASDPNQAT